MFPLITIALVLERRSLPENIRKGRRFRLATEYATLASLIGLVLVVIGVQTDGLVAGWAAVAWTFFGISIALFGAHLLLILLHAENLEDSAPPEGE